MPPSPDTEVQQPAPPPNLSFSHLFAPPPPGDGSASNPATSDSLTTTDLENSSANNISDVSYLSTISDAALNAIICVSIWIKRPDLGVPFRIASREQCQATGFCLSNQRIITHCEAIRYASVIRVKKRLGAPVFVAELVTVMKEWDLALLRVPDQRFWQGIEPLSFGNPPDEDEKLHVVSAVERWKKKRIYRIDRIYSNFYRSLNRRAGGLCLTMRCTGLSDHCTGAPVLNRSSDVVGLVLDDKSIAYYTLADASFIQTFLRDIEKHGRSLGLPGLGFTFQRLQYAGDLRRYLHVPPEKCGVLVRHVYRDGGAYGVLQEGDVVVGIDGSVLTDAGEIVLEEQRPGIEYAIWGRLVGDRIKVDVIRNAVEQRVEYQLKHYDDAHLVPHFEPKLRPEYVIVGGLVFVASSLSYIQTDSQESVRDHSLGHSVRSGDGHSKSRDSARHNEQKEFEAQQVILISHVLEAAVNWSYADIYRQQVISFNDKPIRNLAHFHYLVENCRDEHFVFKLRGKDKIIVLKREEAIESLPGILRTYRVPSAVRISEESMARLETLNICDM